MLKSWGAVTAVPDVRNGVIAIAAGGDFNVVLRTTGSVEAAGGNVYGQTSVPSAAQGSVIAVAAGEGHVLALKSDGAVLAWGRNDAGQTTVPSTAVQVRAIAAGRAFSAALRSDGVIVVWGRDASGPLRPPPAAGGATALRAGPDFLIAKTASGLVVWGSSRAPTVVPAELGETMAFAGGDGFALAVRVPILTRAPGIVHVARGGTVQFSADFPDERGASFEWRRDTLGLTVIPLATNKMLTLHNVTDQSAGTYTLEAVFPTGYRLATSGLLLVDEPPAITQQPAARVWGPENDTRAFSVQASGSGPLSCQWRRNGVPVSGAVTARWNLTPLSAGDAGRYTCVVRNAFGEVESSACELLVLPPKNGREKGTYPIEWGDTIQLHVDVANQPPPFTNFAWTMNGVPIPGQNGPSLTISNFSAADAGVYLGTFTDGFGQTINNNIFRLYPHTIIKHGSGWLVPELARVSPTTAVVARLMGLGDGDGLTYRWQIDDSPSTTIREGVNLLSTTLAAPGQNRFVPFGVYPRQSDGLAGARGSFLGRITWTNQTAPPGELIGMSGPTELLVGETGEFVAEFQNPGRSVIWRKDGSLIAGRTSSRLAIERAQLTNAGTYTASPGGINVNRSISFSLAVNGPPVITRQPANAVIGADGSATLSVSVASAKPGIQSYRWYRDGTEFMVTSGALTTRVPGTYKVRIFDSYGIAESVSATVQARESGEVLVGATPGAYLGSSPGFLAAAYVRGNGTVAVAAQSSSGGLAWFGDATADSRGNFMVPSALRFTGGHTPLEIAAAIPLIGNISGTQVTLELGPLSQQFSAGVETGQISGDEGLYRGVIPGVPEGEAWMIVGPNRRVAIFLHNGFAVYSGSANFIASANAYQVFLREAGFDPELSRLTIDAPGLATITGHARDSLTGPHFTQRLFLTRESSPADARLANLSVRADAGTGDNTLIAGFVLTGPVSRSVVVRGLGPALLNYAVADALLDPQVRLFLASELISENDNWGTNGTALRPAFVRTGAFALSENSRDAALLATIAPGAYTALLLELYSLP